MFSIKKLVVEGIKNKKGYVTLYALMIGLLIVMLSSFILSLESYENKYNLSSEIQILREDDYQRYTEYLLTNLKEYISNNINNISELEIKNYFYNLNANKIITYDEGVVSYNIAKNYFELITPYEERSYRRDCYKYKIVEGKLEFIYFRKEFY